MKHIREWPGFRATNKTEQPPTGTEEKHLNNQCILTCSCTPQVNLRRFRGNCARGPRVANMLHARTGGSSKKRSSWSVCLCCCLRLSYGVTDRRTSGEHGTVISTQTSRATTPSNRVVRTQEVTC